MQMRVTLGCEVKLVKARARKILAVHGVKTASVRSGVVLPTDCVAQVSDGPSLSRRLKIARDFFIASPFILGGGPQGP